MQPDQIDLNQADQNQKQNETVNRTANWLLLALVIGLAVTGIADLFFINAMTNNVPVDPAARTLQIGVLAIASCLVLVAGLGTAIWAITWGQRQLALRRQRAVEVLRQASPDLPQDQLVNPSLPLSSIKQAGLNVLLLLLNLILILPVIYITNGLFARYWPDAPTAIQFAPFILLMGTLIWLENQIIAAIRGPKTGAEPTARSVLSSFLRMALIMVSLLVFVAVAQVVVGGLTSNKDTGNMLLLMAPCVVFVGAIVFLILQNLLPSLWIRSAIKSADYDTAVRRAQWVRGLQPKRIFYLNLEGAALMDAQRYDEALAVFNKSLLESQHQDRTGLEAILLHNKGIALTELGRYAEAKAAFEGVIQIRPEATLVYAAFADLYLRQGIEPQRALELAERALRNRKAEPFIDRLINRDVDGSLLSLRAWALALTGDLDKAQVALVEAYRVTDKHNRPEMAMLNYRAAQVAKLRGDAPAAAKHLRKAIDLDPNGAAGKLARAAG